MEFKVSPGISAVSVTTNLVIPAKGQGREKILEWVSSKTGLASSTSSFVNLYLKENKDGYVLNVLGKNGEPKVQREKIIEI
jgi:hypothetical protein